MINRSEKLEIVLAVMLFIVGVALLLYGSAYAAEPASGYELIRNQHIGNVEYASNK